MVKAKSKILFHLLHEFQLKKKKIVKQSILKVFEAEEKLVDVINYIFCSDDYLLQINKDYLNHDYYTDIITFPLHEEQEAIRADIFISIDRVQDNAKELQLSFYEELYRVMIHGALHLCGYSDKTNASIKKMRQIENKYLELLVSRETKP